MVSGSPHSTGYKLVKFMFQQKHPTRKQHIYKHPLADPKAKVCKRAVFLPSLLINLKVIGIKCSAASQTVYIEFAIKSI